jgi:hypothetical protein
VSAAVALGYGPNCQLRPARTFVRLGPPPRVPCPMEASGARLLDRVGAALHSFAAPPLENGNDIRTLRGLLCHRGMRTTMIYTHVLNRGGRGLRCSLDGIPRWSRESSGSGRGTGWPYLDIERVPAAYPDTRPTIPRPKPWQQWQLPERRAAGAWDTHWPPAAYLDVQGCLICVRPQQQGPQ